MNKDRLNKGKSSKSARAAEASRYDEIIRPRRMGGLVDRHHITIRLDAIGRKIGIDRSGYDWDRLTLRAQAILEGERRS